MRRRGIGRAPAGTTPAASGLAVHASGRYVTKNGSPFLIHGDTPWSIAAQLSDAEVDSYIDDRAAKGFTAIMFNAIEHNFTSQNPAYRNVSGNDPFTSMTEFASGLNSAYWTRVDRIVNRCNANSMVCVINPAYWGYNGGAEGWYSEVQAESDADLQTYGAALANRYTQGNVIWCLGGDYNGADSGARNKQWNIVTGIRSVRTTDIITSHSAPQGDAFAIWSGFTGFGLNFAYPSDLDVYSQCATSYGRAGPVPFFMGEAIYEQERGTPISAAGLRKQTYQALCSGACGQFFGNNPIWHFECTSPLYTYSGTWESNLDSTGSTQQQYVRTLFDAYSWWLLEPKTGTEVISSSLGTGDSRICPSLASDGTFAFIWVPTSQTVTLVKSAFSPSLIRVRLFDPTAGTYSTHTASTANTGTLDVATGGERVVVVDAA
jgi:hypothetical protein